MKRPEGYKWSSYPGYIGEAKENKWVEYSWVLSKLGREEREAKKKYRGYVEEGLRAEVESPLKDLHGQIILGEDTFIEKIKKMLKGKNLSREIVERKRLKEHVPPSEIIKEVARAFGTEEKTIKERGHKDNTARKGAIYFIQRYTGLSNEEIGKLFGGIHFSAVSKAAERLKKEMASDKKLSKLINELDSSFKA